MSSSEWAGSPSRRGVLAGAIVLSVSMLAGCATGFGSPSRHARANLQAASTKIGSNLLIQDAIIALPKGDASPKGGIAYLVFTAINLASQPDQVVAVTAQSVGAAGSSTAASSGSGAPGAPLAGTVQPSSDTTVPAASAGAPGTARISAILRDLTIPLQQGDSVSVTISFKNSGSVSGLFVPVQSADAVGSPFLPTEPPLPSSPPASSSAPASQPAASSPAAPASSSSTAVASTTPSVSPATSS